MVRRKRPKKFQRKFDELLTGRPVSLTVADYQFQTNYVLLQLRDTVKLNDKIVFC